LKRPKRYSRILVVEYLARYRGLQQYSGYLEFVIRQGLGKL